MKPIIKFNNGNGAILCNGCSVIIKSGLTKEEFAGKTDLFLCDKCISDSENMDNIPEEKTYTRSEVIRPLDDALNAIGYDITLQTYPDGTVRSIDAGEWIKKNVK